MNAERDPIEELLASISDGRPIDWTTVGRAVDASGRARLDALRDIARIAEFNRSLQPEADDAPMPARWGDLLLLERLGAGARAEVFRAWDPGLQREVALKLLRPEVDDAALMEEGRAAARIRHPHVATVHGIDQRDGRVGLWMERVRGADLEQEVRTRGPLPAAEVVRLGREMASALAAVHAAGILHRDIKPANVVRDADGRYVLTDFGLGMSRERAASAAVAAGAAGTPMYMAPELLAGGAPGERSDVYSLGLLLWFALAGRHPFEAGTLAELVPAAARGPQPGLAELRAGIPAGLVRGIEQAITPDPARRVTGARALLRLLESLEVDDLLPSAPPAATASASRAGGRGAMLAGSLVVTAVLAVVAVSVWQARRPSAPDRAVPSVGAVPSTGSATAPASPAPYAVEASFVRRTEGGAQRLVTGERVRPGDRLSLEFRATQPAWVYVLNEDEHGERYLLFPQPSYDVGNPLAADTTFVLPGPVRGEENAWTVTTAGGRESFLIVASPKPVSELEAELHRLPAPRAGQATALARVDDTILDRLRGVGGVAALPPGTPAAAPSSAAFERFKALAGRESDVRGVWVRHIAFENPAR